jgi:hypothetical protein
MRRRQNDSPNHAPPWINFPEEKGNKFLRRRGLSCHEEQLFPRRHLFGGKGIKLPWGVISLGEQVLKCLKRKYKG